MLLGCMNQTHEPLTDDVKNEINQEIYKHLEIVAEGFKTMNFDKALAKTLNSSEFKFVTSKGIILSYEEEVKVCKSIPEYFKEIKDYKHSIDHINILSSEMAIATVTYSCKFVQRDNKVLNYPRNVGTFIFRKIDDKWIAVYYHESGLEPEII